MSKAIIGHPAVFAFFAAFLTLVALTLAGEWFRPSYRPPKPRSPFRAE